MTYLFHKIRKRLTTQLIYVLYKVSQMFLFCMISINYLNSILGMEKPTSFLFLAPYIS